MKETFILAALFIFNCLSAAASNYIYDDMTNIGGFMPSSDLGTYSRNTLNGHKKYFISNGNPKYQKLVSEGSIDSHFRVIKSPGLTNALPTGLAREEARKAQNVDGGQTKRPSDTNDAYRKTNEKQYEINTNEIFVLQMSDSKSIGRPNYRSRSSLLSANRSPTFSHKMQSPLKINKPVVKSGVSEKAAASVRKVLNKGGKLTDRMQQRGGRKRDVSSDEDNEVYLEKNKYETAPEGSLTLRRAPLDQAIIANIVDENTEGTNSPYAVFYRMSPDITEQQDTYMVLNTQDERAQNLYKEREAAMNAENEIENDTYRQYPNNVKMHSKVKNFSNFRNFR
ncbi:unnamed protein product, partial [Iphiclides podalirius]